MKYVSGKFELDKRTRRLLHDGTLVVVSQRGIDILFYLIERQGAPVSKKELTKAVWPDEDAVQSRLVKQISLLRQSLENVGDGSAIIETVPGFGYRVAQWGIKATPDVPDVVTPLDSAVPAGTLVTVEPVLSAVTLAAGDSDALSARPRIRRPRRVLFGGLFLVILCYLFLFTISQIEGRFQLGPSGILLAKNSSSFKNNLNFSRDGRLLAYYQSDEPAASGDLVILNLEEDRVTPLSVKLQKSEDMAWAPDNRSIVLVRPDGSSGQRRNLVLATIDGRAGRTVGQVEAGGVDWAPDGQSFAICDHPEGSSASTLIHILSVDGQSKRALTTSSPDEPRHDRRPRFSPDGSLVVFIRQVEWEGGTSEALFIVDVAQGRERQLTFDHARITDVDWSPNGEELFFISDRTGGGHLWRLSIATGREDVQPSLAASIGNQLRSFSLSDNGDLAYVCLPGNATRIDLVPLSVDPLTSLIERKRGRERLPCTLSSISSTHSPVFSPDGRQLAFISDRSGTEEVWVANTDCSDYRQLTFFNDAGLGYPDWSPDGTRIAFTRSKGGQSDIFAVELASNRVEQLTASSGAMSFTRWSHKAGEIYYRQCRSTGSTDSAQSCQLLKLDMARNESVIVSSYFDGEYAESYDQSKLYFTRYGRIWRRDLQSGLEAPVAGMRDIPAGDNWYLRGNQLFIVNRQRLISPTLLRFDLVTGRREQVMNLDAFLPGPLPGVTVSPDGRLLAYSTLVHSDLEIRLVSYFR